MPSETATNLATDPAASLCMVGEPKLSSSPGAPSTRARTYDGQEGEAVVACSPS
jgi:hypothetical protein